MTFDGRLSYLRDTADNIDLKASNCFNINYSPLKRKDTMHAIDPAMIDTYQIRSLQSRELSETKKRKTSESYESIPNMASPSENRVASFHAALMEINSRRSQASESGFPSHRQQ